VRQIAREPFSKYSNALPGRAGDLPEGTLEICHLARAFGAAVVFGAIDVACRGKLNCNIESQGQAAIEKSRTGGLARGRPNADVGVRTQTFPTTDQEHPARDAS
jgi:hypothetical protein